MSFQRLNGRMPLKSSDSNASFPTGLLQAHQQGPPAAADRPLARLRHLLDALPVGRGSGEAQEAAAPSWLETLIALFQAFVVVSATYH